MKSCDSYAMIGGMLLAVAVTASLAQEARKTASLSIDLDPTLVRSLSEQDATLIYRLRKQEDTSESASKLLQSLGLKAIDPADESRLKKKELVLRHQYQVEKGGRNVLVYARPDSWREERETIVICDSDFCVLDWREVGGHSDFESVRVKTGPDGKPLLTLTRRESLLQHRIDPNKERGYYDYSLSDDKVERVGDVRWESLLPPRRSNFDPVTKVRF